MGVRSLRLTVRGVRRGAVIALMAGLAVGIPSVAVLARPRHSVAPPPLPPPPPPPPPASPVGLPDQMITDAASYEGLMQRVAATSPAFTGPDDVAKALKAGGAYEAKTFLRGAIAYAAVAALKDQAFVEALRDAGNTPEHRQDMVRDIELNPVYLNQFKDADVAAGYAKAALGSAALNLVLTGRKVRDEAYSMQHQAWSNTFVEDRPGRLSAIETESSNGIAPAPDETAVVRDAATEVKPLDITGPPVEPPYSPIINRALQVAAIAALGEATNTSYLNLASLVEDNETEECLERAKRDLFQCLAVAKPNYEDVFCMGRHEMVDPGQCLAHSVSFDIPEEPAPPPPEPKTPKRHKGRISHYAKTHRSASST